MLIVPIRRYSMSDRRERVSNHGYSNPGFEQLSSLPSFQANIHTPCIKAGGQRLA